ncbi:MAG: amidohydrolase [Phyllobacterium sp.]
MTRTSSSRLFFNGRVYRHIDDDRPANAILVDNGSVCWIGDRDDAPLASQYIDVEGATVLPGITDAHVHLFAIANASLQLDASGFATIEALLTAISNRARTLPPGHWLQVSGFDENHLDDDRRYPSLRELDAACPHNPIVVRRFCGHVAIANSAVLSAAGIASVSDAPEGGTFGSLPDGVLDGSAFEAAAELIFRAVPPPTPAEMKRALLQAIRFCNTYGITAAVEAAVGFTYGFDTEYAIWNGLRADQPSLPLRLGFMLQLDAAGAAARNLHPAADRDWQLDTLKFFSDGIVGGRTAAMFEPYEDTNSTGLFMRPESELESLMLEGARAGWRLAVHSVGDRSSAKVLDILEKVVTLESAAGRRNRIEHFFCPPENGYDRLAKLGALLVMQPSFLSRMHRSFVPAFGPRVHSMYPGRSAISAGVKYVASSDAPTGFLSPWIGMADAVDRAARAGGPFGPDEALTPRAALGAYIHGGAYAMRHEMWRSTLLPGMAADLILVDRDPMHADAGEIAATRCLMTMVRGRIVHEDNCLRGWTNRS